MSKMKCLNLLLAVIFSLATLCQAEEKMDVDLSDSLDFEAFHTDKKSAVKIWDDKKVEKTYENKSTSIDPSPTQKPAVDDGTPNAKTSTAPTEPKTGKRYEIRELYSISGSERTGYTPTTVVQALYLQMQGLCPAGWRKLDERSQPDGNDAFYMYYAFECL